MHTLERVSWALAHGKFWKGVVGFSRTERADLFRYLYKFLRIKVYNLWTRRMTRKMK